MAAVWGWAIAAATAAAAAAAAAEAEAEATHLLQSRQGVMGGAQIQGGAEVIQLGGELAAAGTCTANERAGMVSGSQ